jgi:hypothetical protein
VILDYIVRMNIFDVQGVVKTIFDDMVKYHQLTHFDIVKFAFLNKVCFKVVNEFISDTKQIKTVVKVAKSVICHRNKQKLFVTFHGCIRHGLTAREASNYNDMNNKYIDTISNYSYGTLTKALFFDRKYTDKVDLARMQFNQSKNNILRFKFMNEFSGLSQIALNDANLKRKITIGYRLAETFNNMVDQLQVVEIRNDEKLNKIFIENILSQNLNIRANGVHLCSRIPSSISMEMFDDHKLTQRKWSVSILTNLECINNSFDVATTLIFIPSVSIMFKARGGLSLYLKYVKNASGLLDVEFHTKKRTLSFRPTSLPS